MSKKGATKSGGTGSRKRAKDQEMAANMKNVVRTTANCPICHKIVSLNKIPFGHDCG